MKAPFALPVMVNDDFLIARDAELICLVRDATADEQAYIVHVINMHDRMAAAIERFVAAETALTSGHSNVSGVGELSKAIAERIEAVQELVNIHNELKGN